MTSIAADLETVYARLESNSVRFGGVARSGLPTIEVVGGSINVYASNNPTKPTSKSTMTQVNTAIGPGIFVVQGISAWILFDGTGVEVYCSGVIDVQGPE